MGRGVPLATRAFAELGLASMHASMQVHTSKFQVKKISPISNCPSALPLASRVADVKILLFGHSLTPPPPHPAGGHRKIKIGISIQGKVKRSVCLAERGRPLALFRASQVGFA